MTKAEKKEIKRALLGKIEPTADGRLTVCPVGQLWTLGVGDGATAVRLLGVARRARCYETKQGEAKVLKTAADCMLHVGRALVLQEQPQTPACLCRYLLTRPVVLTFRFEEGVPVLTAWTGRGLTGWISQRRAIRAFEAHLPDAIKLSDRKPPKDKKEEKPPKEKKAKKKKPLWKFSK